VEQKVNYLVQISLLVASVLGEIYRVHILLCGVGSVVGIATG
jgi:hypothetical protein